MASGWRLTWVLSLVVAVMAVVLAAGTGFSSDGVRMAVRATARTSLFLFCLAFAASSLVRLWPNDFTRWNLRNRRYLGVSFAASHLVHGIFIIAYAVVDPVAYQAQSSLGMYVVGGLAYVFIAAMAATSFDTTAVMIGPRAWRLLHTTGAHYIWLIFVLSNLGRVQNSALYAVPLLLLLAVMTLRLTVWLRDRNARAAARMA